MIGILKILLGSIHNERVKKPSFLTNKSKNVNNKSAYCDLKCVEYN